MALRLYSNTEFSNVKHQEWSLKKGYVLSEIAKNCDTHSITSGALMQNMAYSKNIVHN